MLLLVLKSYSKQVERKLALIHFLLILNGEAWEVTSSSALIWLKVNREKFLGFTICQHLLYLRTLRVLTIFNFSGQLSSQIHIKTLKLAILKLCDNCNIFLRTFRLSRTSFICYHYFWNIFEQMLYLTKSNLAWKKYYSLWIQLEKPLKILHIDASQQLIVLT